MTWSRWISCGLAAGIALFLVGTAFYILVPILAPGIPPQFLNDELFRPWTGWTSTYMLLHPFAFAFVYYRYRHRRWRRLLVDGNRRNMSGPEPFQNAARQ